MVDSLCLVTKGDLGEGSWLRNKAYFFAYKRAQVPLLVSLDLKKKPWATGAGKNPLVL